MMFICQYILYEITIYFEIFFNNIGIIYIYCRFFKLPLVELYIFYITRKPPSASIQRLLRVKLLAHVTPSPVGPAIVMGVCPSPPIPTPTIVAAFFVKIVVSISLANLVIRSTFFENMDAV